MPGPGTIVNSGPINEPTQLALALDHAESLAREDFLAGPSNAAALDLIERYAPGLSGKILGRAVLSPLDLERENPNLIGGDSTSGSHHLDQNFLMRPVFGWSRYKTPVRNLYLCGASTWPGAGVNAGSGFMLAKMLAGDPS